MRDRKREREREREKGNLSTYVSGEREGEREGDHSYLRLKTCTYYEFLFVKGWGNYPTKIHYIVSSASCCSESLFSKIRDQ